MSSSDLTSFPTVSLILAMLLTLKCIIVIIIPTLQMNNDVGTMFMFVGHLNIVRLVSLGGEGGAAYVSLLPIFFCQVIFS